MTMDSAPREGARLSGDLPPRGGGSERIGRAGVTGQLATEGKHINLSLHHLEHVIVALAERKKGEHIPYRNSLLTSVLRDSLGGNSLTTMIATVSMDRRNVQVDNLNGTYIHYL